MRFIGELVKFRMYSKIEALYCLKLLLHDFTHHHIEMCCSLLETCGRFLFRNPDSHQRTKVYLVSLYGTKDIFYIKCRVNRQKADFRAIFCKDLQETVSCVKFNW